MPDATFTRPDLTTFTRLDGLGLEVTGQLLEPDRSVLACRVVEPDDWCRRCGCQGVPRDTVSRELAHEPFGWRPTTLVLTVRRYRCKEGSHVWRQVRAREGSVRHVEVFRTGCVRTPIIGGPRPLSGHRRAQPCYTLICEEPRI